MKPMTIWQRLDRALLLLILLLFVAVGLAFWVALERANASQRSDQLSRDRDRVVLRCHADDRCFARTFG